MRCLVTGGSGFVGGYLVQRLLDRGDDVAVLDLQPPRQRVPWLQADIGAGCPDLAGYEVIYHLAASSQTPAAMRRVNVEGTRQALEAAWTAGARRFVFVSSLATMGLPQPGRLLTEEDSFAAPSQRYPYAASKWEAERVALSFLPRGPEVVIVNPGPIIGLNPEDPGSARLVLQVRHLPFLPVPRGGACYVGVQDVVAGLILAAEKGRPGERYILGSENLANLALGRLIAERVGWRRSLFPMAPWILDTLAPLAGLAHRLGLFPFPSEIIRMSGSEAYASNARACRELGFRPAPVRQVVDDMVGRLEQQGRLPTRAAGFSG